MTTTKQVNSPWPDRRRWGHENRETHRQADRNPDQRPAPSLSANGTENCRPGHLQHQVPALTFSLIPVLGAGAATPRPGPAASQGRGSLAATPTHGYRHPIQSRPGTPHVPATCCGSQERATKVHPDS